MAPPPSRLALPGGLALSTKYVLLMPSSPSVCNASARSSSLRSSSSLRGVHSKRSPNPRCVASETCTKPLRPSSSIFTVLVTPVPQMSKCGRTLPMLPPAVHPVCTPIRTPISLPDSLLFRSTTSCMRSAIRTTRCGAVPCGCGRCGSSGVRAPAQTTYASPMVLILSTAYSSHSESNSSKISETKLRTHRPLSLLIRAV
mmetsp:Transcript_20430/g.51997  ORF Transcript_20430/g.51997 Transcript_20430/m.51997 type:complete len:200 (-) Transcript_20430:1079-1678(-)